MEQKKTGYHIDGKAQALDLLQHLGAEEQKKILSQISAHDPQMAEFLQQNLVQFKHLKFLTPKMLVLYLKKISLSELGLALRGADQDLRDFFLTQCSKMMKAEIELTLKGPLRPLSEVQRAQQKCVEVLKGCLESGEIILDPNSKTV